ncbi:Palmitoyl-protein thioesterase 1 [Gurleya vavrai]
MKFLKLLIFIQYSNKFITAYNPFKFVSNITVFDDDDEKIKTAVKLINLIKSIDNNSEEIDKVYESEDFEFKNKNLSCDEKLKQIKTYLTNYYLEKANECFELHFYQCCINYCLNVLYFEILAEATNMLCISNLKIGCLYEARYVHHRFELSLIEKIPYKCGEYDFDEEMKNFNYGDVSNFDDSYDNLIGADFFESVLEKLLLSKRITLNYIYAILRTGYDLMANLDNISYIDTEKEIYIFGGIRGEFYNTFKILDKINDIDFNFYKSYILDTNKIFVFNGNYIGQGPYQIENYLFLLLLKILYPKNIFLNRGYSEFKSSSISNGFLDLINEIYFAYDKDKELISKFESKLFIAFNLTFSMHPISTIINRKIYVTNEGIPKKINLLLNLTI